MRRATGHHRAYLQYLCISIHALLAESDAPQGSRKVFCKNFYPRSPCGERQLSNLLVLFCYLFLSTLSLRRATVTVLGIQHRVGISIHALLAESDSENLTTTSIEMPFLSTLSLRRATGLPFVMLSSGKISIHALLAESDLCSSISVSWMAHFYPRSPCGERLMTSLLVSMSC